MVRMCSAFSQTAFGSNGSSSVKFTMAFAVIDAFERKCVDQFLARHLLAIVLRRPAQQAQKIDEALRQKSGVAIGGDADHRPVLALRKLRAVGSDQQRQMRELRRLDAERLENQHVLEGVGQMILAANDVADAQIGIVGAGGHVIGRHAVAAQQREIFDIGRRLSLAGRRPDRVNATSAASLARHPEAHDALGSRDRRKSLRQNFLGHAAVQIEPLALPVKFVPPKSSHFRPSKIESSDSWVLRSTSVSSMRRIMVPSLWRAYSQLKMNVLALPMWR